MIDVTAPIMHRRDAHLPEHDSLADRYGRTKRGAQRWICRVCGRTWQDPHYRSWYPKAMIARVQELAGAGASKNEIAADLTVSHRDHRQPHPSTVSRWMTRARDAGLSAAPGPAVTMSGRTGPEPQAAFPAAPSPRAGGPDPFV